jgi:hypothetical protein
MAARLAAVASFALGSGCVETPSTQKGADQVGTADTATSDTRGTTPTGDTATGTPNACPADVELLWAALCVETTALLDGPTSTLGGPTPGSWVGYEDIDATGTGTVTEVGGALAAVPGSVPAPGFDACDVDHAQQVRLIDDAGATWTVGWDLSRSPLDDRSADGIAVGEVLDFLVRFRWLGWSTSRALLLSDAGGPRVLFETHEELSDTQLGGVSVEIDYDDTCFTPGEHFPLVEHYRVTLTGPGGTVDLRSGQQATLATAGRDLDFTVTGSFWYDDCADGCGGTELAAWETP